MATKEPEERENQHDLDPELDAMVDEIVETGGQEQRKMVTDLIMEQAMGLMKAFISTTDYDWQDACATMFTLADMASDKAGDDSVDETMRKQHERTHRQSGSDGPNLGKIFYEQQRDRDERIP